MQKGYFVKASEIEDYVYCKRGWWLGKNGLRVVNDQMEKGTRDHQGLATEVRNYSFLKHAVQIFIILILVFLLLILYFYFG